MEIKKVRKEGEEANTKKTTWCGHGHHVGGTMWAIDEVLLSAVGYRAGWREDRREGRTGKRRGRKNGRQRGRDGEGAGNSTHWLSVDTGQIHFTPKPLHT